MDNPIEKKAEAPKQQPEAAEVSLLKPGENEEAAADRQAEEFRAKGPEMVKPADAKLARAVDKAKAEGWNVA